MCCSDDWIGSTLASPPDDVVDGLTDASGDVNGFGVEVEVEVSV